MSEKTTNEQIGSLYRKIEELKEKIATINTAIDLLENARLYVLEEIGEVQKELKKLEES